MGAMLVSADDSSESADARLGIVRRSASSELPAPEANILAVRDSLSAFQPRRRGTVYLPVSESMSFAHVWHSQMPLAAEARSPGVRSGS